MDCLKSGQSCKDLRHAASQKTQKCHLSCKDHEVGLFVSSFHQAQHSFSCQWWVSSIQAPLVLSGKVVPNYCSILPQSSLKFSAPKFSCTDDFFLLKNRASLFHSSELSGLLGDIVLLTAFCCWFCNSSNTVCFHHFVAYASKKPSCYQWMDSGYSLYLDHVFI